MGVFATRSPFRPNPVGLSCEKLETIKKIPGSGCVLIVSGADLMEGSPIYDIKPYLSFTDSHPDAINGFAEETYKEEPVDVEFPEELLKRIPEEKREALIHTLSLDPRPGYLRRGEEPYGFTYAGMDIRFRVTNGILKVFDVLIDY